MASSKQIINSATTRQRPHNKFAIKKGLWQKAQKMMTPTLL